MDRGEQDKRVQRAQQTMDQIIEAAEKLFQEKGFAATSMSEVAKAANVTKSLIHHHFGSKESLWDAVCGKNQARMQKYLASILDESSSVEGGFLEHAITAFFQHIEKNPGFSKLQTWVAAEQRSQRSMQLETLAELEQRLRDDQERGNIRSDLDPRQIIFLYWSIVEHWHSAKHIFAKRFGSTLGPGSNETYLRTALEIFMKGARA